MQGLADEEGIDENLLTSGWIQIGLGSANNTACDLKSCQASSQWLKFWIFREKIMQWTSKHHLLERNSIKLFIYFRIYLTAFLTAPATNDVSASCESASQARAA